MRSYQKSDKCVCSKCVNDIFIKSYIRKKGKKGQCDFCGANRNLIAVNDLLDRLEYYLDCMYDANDNPSPVDGGTYLLDDGVNFFDFIDYDVDCSEEFKDFLKQNWDTSNTYYPSDIKLVEHEGQNLFVDWNKFVNEVKNKSNHLPAAGDDNSCCAVLAYIQEHILQAGGLKIFEPGRKIYRARHGIQELSYRELGAPPSQYSNGNRLSIDGISCFYGAFSETTCLKEISCDAQNEYSIGEWTPCRPLFLIDLSDSQYYGKQIYNAYSDSIWNKEKLSLFPTMSFLAFFVKAISVPVTDKNSEEKQNLYRATQFVGEYFRLNNFPDGRNIDGIIYKSSKAEKQKNVIFFCNSTECCDRHNKTTASMLMLKKARTSEERFWRTI